MKYYKQLNESGEIIALMTYDFEANAVDDRTVEITPEEHKAISNEWTTSARERNESQKAEKEMRAKEKALKLKAYDIMMGVSE